MTKVTLTYTFDSNEAAIEFMQRATGGVPTATPVAEKPAAAPAPAPKAEKPAAAPAPAPKPAAPAAPSADEVTAAMNAVKDKFGAPAAKAIIAECGYAKLVELNGDADARTKAKAAADAKLASGDDGI